MNPIASERDIQRQTYLVLAGRAHILHSMGLILTWFLIAFIVSFLGYLFWFALDGISLDIVYDLG